MGAVLDADGVQRRGLLYADTATDSPHRTVPNLALALAYGYLEGEGIYPQASEDGGWLQLGQATFYPFRNHTGGYVTASDRGYQVLLDWRWRHYQTVTVGQVLEGTVDPETFRDRIAIIGADAPLKDRFSTPLVGGEEMPRSGTSSGPSNPAT